MKSKWNKALALLLCALLLAGSLPLTARADEPAEETSAESRQEAETETEAEEVALDASEVACAEADSEAATEELNVDEAPVVMEDAPPQETEFELFPEITGEETEGEDPAGEEGEPDESGEAGLLRVGELIPGDEEIALGESATLSLEISGAERATWRAERSDGAHAAEGEVSGGSFTWKPEAAGVYMITVLCSGGGETASASTAITVRGGALKVSAESAGRSAVAGRVPMEFRLSATGGVEPYAVKLTVEVDGQVFYASDMLEEALELTPVRSGTHTLSLEVTDAEGKTASAEASVAVSEDVSESRSSWERTLPRLRADMTFAEKLLAVARSQLGYQESTVSFVVEDDGRVNGYTRYGDWYGCPYEEWCAMFVSFCLHYAGISEKMIPYAANNRRWKAALGDRYIDDEDSYTPQPGDIVYFHHNRAGSTRDPDAPNHVGIVTRVDENGFSTIEGNSANRVRERSYGFSDSCIVGYFSMAGLMEQYDPSYVAPDRMVTFAAPLGVGLVVDGVPAETAEILAPGGKLTFRLAAEPGVEIVDVRVNNGYALLQEGDEYTLAHIDRDDTLVEIEARIAEPEIP